MAEQTPVGAEAGVAAGAPAGAKSGETSGSTGAMGPYAALIGAGVGFLDSILNRAKTQRERDYEQNVAIAALKANRERLGYQNSADITGAHGMVSDAMNEYSAVSERGANAATSLTQNAMGNTGGDVNFAASAGMRQGLHAGAYGALMQSKMGINQNLSNLQHNTNAQLDQNANMLGQGATDWAQTTIRKRLGDLFGGGTAGLSFMNNIIQQGRTPPDQEV